MTQSIAVSGEPTVELTLALRVSTDSEHAAARLLKSFEDTVDVTLTARTFHDDETTSGQVIELAGASR
ncbi:hypothetical protein [Amycolatopsis sp. lyj-112]|uniref:hypothetical protein n=1 Tax=Amycolatopsis sp. lyj-112 TaxID=2789288 RepID=UPI00397C4727